MSTETEKARTEKAIEVFGFDPRNVGERHRDWWVIDKPDDVDKSAGAQAGYLCVKARDGASNPPDCSAGTYGIYIGTVEDDFDCTYRYYYYAPLEADKVDAVNATQDTSRT